MEKSFFTVAEAATILSIGRSMIYRLMASGKLHSVRIAGTRARRIPRASLDQFIEREAQAQQD